MLAGFVRDGAGAGGDYRADGFVAEDDRIDRAGVAHTAVEVPVKIAAADTDGLEFDGDFAGARVAGVFDGAGLEDSLGYDLDCLDE